MTIHYVKSGASGVWATGTAYSVGARRVCRRAYGAGDAESARMFVYECTTGGTSHGSTEPTWPTTPGDTVDDNGVIWTCRACSSWTNAGYFLDYLSHGATPGDSVYVSPSYAMTYAAGLNILFGQYVSAGADPPSNYLMFPDAPVHVLCVDESTGAVSEGAAVTVPAGTTAWFGDGYMVYRGITFTIGTQANVYYVLGHSYWIIFDKCTFNLLSTCATDGGISPGFGEANTSTAEFIDCTIDVAAGLASAIDARYGPRIRFYGGRFTGSPNGALMRFPTGEAAGQFGEYIGEFYFRGMDVSVFSTLVGIGGYRGWKDILFEDCKIDSGATVASGDWSTADRWGPVVEVRNSGGASGTFRSQREEYDGAVSADLATYRNAGAMTQSAARFALKMTTRTAGSSMTFPLRTKQFNVRNAVVSGNKTLTVHFLHDSATALTDKDIWLELMFLGDANSPLGTWARNRGSVLPAATANDCTTSSEAWTHSMSAPKPQQLAITFAPRKAGYVTARVALAKPNYSVYVCPKAALS